MKSNITYRILSAIPINAFDPSKMSIDIVKNSKTRFDSYQFFSELLSLGVFSEKVLYQTYSNIFNIPLLSSDEKIPNSALQKLIPEDICRKHKYVPIRLNPDGSVLLSISNPFDRKGIELAKFILDKKINFKLATEADISRIINVLFGEYEFFDSQVGNKIKLLDFETIPERNEVEEDIIKELEKSSQGPIVRLFNIIITDAIFQRTSDIHIEPQDNHLNVRYRIDGDLFSKIKLPKDLHLPLIGRIKVLSKLDIAKHFVPQDGRIRFNLDSRFIDLRISILPTIFGEKCVIRILDSGILKLTLSDLGYNNSLLESFTKKLLSPHGIILVTGPTGSGKSTTLYIALNYIMNKHDKINITTVEDPVEHVLKGTNQVQVNERQGMTFSSALRSILRQDPDVIFIGEIRDLKTAEIAIQSAQTGHLVLSTLHTNDSIGAISRLNELNIESSLIRESVLAILAQRLLKRICPHCKRKANEGEYSPNEVLYARKFYPDIQFYKGDGCSKCNNTGFLGRIAVVELMSFTSDVREAMNSNDDDHILKVAREAGMIPLETAGIELVSKGITELESTLRIVGNDF